MSRYSGLIMARAPSSAVTATEGSNSSICPVARARSLRGRPALLVHVDQGGPRVLLTPRMVNFDDNLESSSHACAASSQRGVADRARRTAPRGGNRLRVGCLAPAKSGRPVARFDDVVDQTSHVILAAWCRLAESPASIPDTITAAFS